MRKRVTLRLDRFGQDALEDYVRGPGGSHSAVLHTAVRYYLADADSGRIAWRVPQLARGAEFAGALEVELDDDLHAQLELESRRQQVTPDLLAAHAVLYFLTDLDTGRAAARLGDAINRDAEAN
jgi:hypothetical protein